MKYIEIDKDIIDISAYRFIRDNTNQKDGVTYYEVLFFESPEDTIARYTVKFPTKIKLDNFLAFVRAQVGSVKFER